MKKVFVFLFTAFFIFLLTACGAKTQAPVTPDYSDIALFEADLNQGKDLTGKTVQFTVTELVPDSAFGYNMQTGKHLNFCSSSNPKVSTGDTVTVEVTEVRSVMGSYIISYKMK